MRQLLIIAALATGACVDLQKDRRVLVNTELELSQTPRVLRPAEPLRAIGPYNTLCLDLPAEDSVETRDMGPNSWKVRRRDGSYVTPSVTLIGPDGRRDNLPLAGEWGHDICFETRPPRDLARRYTEVELRADGPLRILGVRWEAGNRYASL